MSEEKTNFLVTRANEGQFESMGGSRDWLKIKDLGLSEATNGKFDAWKTRAAEMGGSTGRHFHNYDFQIMFVLKGWVKMYYEGEGEMILNEGDFVYHPKGHVHDFMEYSEDLELLEMASPANHHSIEV
jgi:mannose-6-phosphate isomerase-like protein (cupin superfamily)